MLEPWIIALRLLLAAVLGGVIGANRERRDWAAGLRTHMLVSVGAALAMIVSAYGFADVLGKNVILDPSRIAAQVISGIGFIGAGTILFMQREQVVRGLTTAAGLWAVAAIGLAAGSGLYIAAALATGIAWIILAVVQPLEKRVFPHRRLHPRMTLRLRGSDALARVDTVLRERKLPLVKLTLRDAGDGKGGELLLRFSSDAEPEQLSALADALRADPDLSVERVDVTL